MIENFARVARVEGGDAWVEASRPVGCGRCHENPGCEVNRGQSCQTTRSEIRVGNALGARPGERVVVGVPDGAVWRVAALVYLLPLGLALAGAVLAQLVLGGRIGVAALAAAGGLLLGLLLARLAQGRARTREFCNPVILRRDVSSS